MKHVLCYGDSNTWGCVPLVASEAPRRYAPDDRWPGVMRRELGRGYAVWEAGLNGRTTVWDDELEPHRNGRELLLPTLQTHQPLDLVIVMLGTNDLKRRFGLGASEIADGAAQLVDLVRRSACGPMGSSPQVLLVCPPPLGRLSGFSEDFDGGPEKSRDLAQHFAVAVIGRACAFVDAGEHVASSDTDGVHLDREAHAVLGSLLADEVRQILRAL